MARVGQQRRGDRRIDAARHGDDDAHGYRSASAVRPSRRSLVTRRGSTPIDEVDVLGGRRRAEAEPQRIPRERLRQAHGLENVRRFERARRTRGPGRHRDALEVERDQQRLRLDAVEADVGRVRNAAIGRAVHGRARHAAPGCRPRADPAAPRLRPPWPVRRARAAPRRPCRRCPARSRCRRAGSAPGGRRSPARRAARRVRIHSAPTPLGPPNLCADIDSRSTPRARTAIGILPAAWTASVCSSAPRGPTARRRSRPRGWMVPISLLASMTETRAVSAVTWVPTAPGSTMPSRPRRHDDRLRLHGRRGPWLC